MIASGAARRDSKPHVIPEVARLTLKNPKVFSSIVRARKTHPDKASSSLTYWLTLSEAEVMRLRIKEGDRVSAAILSVERADEEEEEDEEENKRKTEASAS
jgi:hypothetical protein